MDFNKKKGKFSQHLKNTSKTLKNTSKTPFLAIFGHFQHSQKNDRLNA
jgi:hypothetical protein